MNDKDRSTDIRQIPALSELWASSREKWLAARTQAPAAQQPAQAQAPAPLKTGGGAR